MCRSSRTAYQSETLQQKGHACGIAWHRWDQPLWQCAEYMVPVAATILPTELAGAYRHYKRTTTAAVRIYESRKYKPRNIGEDFKVQLPGQ